MLPAMQEHVFQDELGGQGGDGQIDALEAQRGMPKIMPDHGRHRRPAEQGQEKGHAQLLAKHRRAVGPHADEGPVPQGHLAAESGQQVQGDGPDDRDEDQVQDGHDR
jgi:hypothetical protein